MAPDKILELIDKCLGTPDNETEEERIERKKMILRDAEARRIRKAANPS